MHQIDASKIPQTNFRVKQKILGKSVFKITLKCIIFIILSLHICFYSKWSNFVGTLTQFKLFNFIEITTNSFSLIFSGLILLIITWDFLYNLIKTQKNKSIFRRLKFQGNEIEIFEKSDESYFDKYLNEVLYLFDNSNADVIVFEDMDRYNVNKIFQRLREVNTLINSKRGKAKKPLRFFYLIRDDIFISKDRTKFFDFIIPVVPVIDSSNSYNQFISHFKNGGVFDMFDQHFLQGISLYVDDMRILKNIYNEFMIYYDRIRTTEQDYNKLLAMIVYKNIFPRDFSDTQINKGFVSTLFNGKEEIIKDEVNRFNGEIEEIRQEIKIYEKEYLVNIDELNSTYTRRNYNGNSYVDVNNTEYIKRKKRIEFIQSGGIDSLKDNIQDLENKKSTLYSQRVQNIITRENIDTIFNINYKNFLNEENSFREIKSSNYFRLIKYLIRNGYIDETYEDYMTYFYPNSLTTNDKMFLRSVMDKKAKQWTYKINNAELVLSRLIETDFGEIEILNFSLFDYILDTKGVNSKYLIIFINQLKDKEYFSFMQQYFNAASNQTLYVESINKYWPSFFSEVIKRNGFSYKQTKEYILITLYYCDDKNIDELNSDNILTTFIASDPLFLDIEEPKVEKLIVQFSKLNIKFKQLNYDRSHKDLFYSIYNNKFYEFTFDNISLMIKHIYNIQNQDDIHHNNYSLVEADSTSKLFEYVNENIDLYMRIILDNCEGIITDNPHAVQELLNNEYIEISKRKEYIDYLQTQIELLENIQEKSFWDLFLEKKLICYSENNILNYYFKSGNGLNGILISFINDYNELLEFSSNDINSKYGENSSLAFFNSVIISQTIADEKYKSIIDDLNHEYHNFNIEGISDQKIKILIELGTIKMTAENIRFMRTAYINQLIYFIEYNISQYIAEIIDIEPILFTELICILDSNIEDDFKIDLISHTQEPITVISKKYSDDVKKYILLHNLDTSEIIPLIGNYQNQGDAIKEILRDLSKKYIGSIIDNNIDLSIELFEYLLSKEDISIESKLAIMTDNMIKFSKLQCENYIKIIGSKEHEKVFTGRPKLEITKINKRFLEKCKSKHWISDFYVENEVLKITRRKLHSSIGDSLL